MVITTYRLGSKDFSVYEIKGKSCIKSKKEFPNAIHIAELFKANKNLSKIIDSKNKKFLMGSFSKNKPKGAKITILPNGESLSRAYSIFAPNLEIHDEKSSSHWDAIFQNPSGKMCYLYTLKKKEKSKKNKFKKVQEFQNILQKLKRNLKLNLKSDPMCLPMLILLTTKMRVGNEIYYKNNSHKGLTTLKKKDIYISKDKITFDFIAKDGVPMKITEKFTPEIVTELKKTLSKKKPNNFVFVKNSHPIKDTEFEKTFEKYCGQKFYPHIVRSHYATEEVLNFLNKNENPTKEEVKKFYLGLANKLGHKKFSKNNGWQDSYQVTLNYYIDPSLIKKLERKIK